MVCLPSPLGKALTPSLGEKVAQWAAASALPYLFSESPVKIRPAGALGNTELCQFCRNSCLPSPLGSQTTPSLGEKVAQWAAVSALPYLFSESPVKIRPAGALGNTELCQFCRNRG